MTDHTHTFARFWKCALQQYAGRLRREHANKSSVRMWERRQCGNNAISYRFAVAAIGNDTGEHHSGVRRQALSNH